MESKYIIAVCIIAPLILACTEEISVNFEGAENGILVVEGGITTEKKAHEIRLSRSLDYFTSESAPVVSDAVVTIQFNDSLLTLEEKDIPGIYYTPDDFAATVGVNYRLDISLVGGSCYRAESTVRPLQGIDTVIIQYREKDENGEYKYGVLYYGPEPEGESNYYMWDYYIDDVLQSDTITEKSFHSDQFVDGQYIHDFDVFTIHDYQIKEDTSVVRLAIYSISAEYYYFLTAIKQETEEKGDMYDTPSANVPSNLSNGALGFFNARNVKWKETVLIRNK